MTEDFLALARAAERDSRAREDADYPIFHVVPPVGRLNDPNGLIVDGDAYHAFFQYTPEFPKKLVYWGHAVSRDLVHWDYLEPAILPDCHQDANGAYSGTAIGVEGGVELWYTGNYKDPESGEREATQCLVETSDLKSFHKTVGPIIARQPEGYTAHFRDPQVWQDPDDPAGSYRMMLGVQREDLSGTILLYRSSDRRHWDLEGEMTFPDAGGTFDSFGYMWECPNLLRLRDEESGETSDVLIFCPQGIAPEREGFENIFPCVYIVGSLVGTEFRSADGSFEEVDRGFEFYAPQAYARRASGWGRNAEDEENLLLGWAGNASEDDQPSIATGGWVHALTSPRALSLRAGRLIQRPLLPGLPLEEKAATGARADLDCGIVPSATNCEPASASYNAKPACDFKEIEALSGSRSWRVKTCATIDEGGAIEFDMGEDCGLTIRIEANRLLVDRSASRYPHGGSRVVTLEAGDANSIEIVHDRSLTEVFCGDGRLAFTFRSFLNAGSSGLRVRVEGDAALKDFVSARLD